ncbi:hypothetical protein HPB50_020328 [Hyalomma asiaticum]|uniref:Uncharacterized protein n=1 Tax=Hyalomma asiaticum TaxID=266040 RepID=A0ACB7SK32_HYAAI|nr:hypothetical protein HPB50_020328 [Hyalomma asiaticum]
MISGGPHARAATSAQFMLNSSFVLPKHLPDVTASALAAMLLAEGATALSSASILSADDLFENSLRLRLPLRLRLLRWLRERERSRSLRWERSRLRLRLRSLWRLWYRWPLSLRELPPPRRSRLRLPDRLRLLELLRRRPCLELSVSWERETSNMGIKAGVCHYGISKPRDRAQE